jgi:hypothetical protein
VSDQQIRLVLDISAVLAYAGGFDDVGETITQVRENGEAFTAGVLTLAAARSAARADFAGLVDALTAHPAWQPAALDTGEWRPLAATFDTLRRQRTDAPDLTEMSAAEALVLSFRGNAVNVLTARPQLYAVLGDDPPIIEI